MEKLAEDLEAGDKELQIIALERVYEFRGAAKQLLPIALSLFKSSQDPIITCKAGLVMLDYDLTNYDILDSIVAKVKSEREDIRRIPTPPP